MTQTQTPPAPQPAKPKRGGMTIFFLLFILLVGAIGAACVFQLNKLSEQNASFRFRLNTLTQQSNAHTQSLDELHSQISELKTLTGQVETLNQAVRQNQAKLKTAQSRLTVSDLDQVTYLLDLAMKRLVFERDVHSAITLLTQAHAICQGAAVPGIETLCSAIMQDKRALELVRQPDPDSILEKLAQLKTELNTLNETSQNLKISQLSAPEDNNTRDFGKIEGFQAHLHLALKRITDFISNHLVKVHRLDSTETPRLLLNEFKYRANIQDLLIQQARLAVITHNQTVFQTSLTELKNLLQQHYTPIDAASALRLLTNLQKIQLQPDLPLLKHSTSVIEQAGRPRIDANE